MHFIFERIISLLLSHVAVVCGYWRSTWEERFRLRSLYPSFLPKGDFIDGL